MSYANLTISITALILSACSIYYSIKNDHRSWKRAAVLPYYLSLLGALDEIEANSQHTIGVYHNLQLVSFAKTADLLGLHQVYFHITDIMICQKKIEDLLHKDERKLCQEKQLLDSILQSVAALKALIKEDSVRLTRKF